MMKTQYLLKYAFISGLLALLLYGCVYSVHPLFNEDDLIFKKELLGTWTDQDDNTWLFEEGKDNYYEVTHIEESDTTNLVGGLGRIGEHYFLDFTIGDIDKLHDMELFHLFPTHTFAKIQFEENGIKMVWFTSKWLEDLIKEKRIRIKHELENDIVLLTASTDELQKFVQKYADEPKAFGDPGQLTRKDSH